MVWIAWIGKARERLCEIGAESLMRSGKFGAHSAPKFGASLSAPNDVSETGMASAFEGDRPGRCP